MEVIPVLDLKEGAVVHARMGHRSRYRAIETPLSSTNHPIDVARGLLSIYPFRTVYVADLDAIERNGHNNAALSQLKNELPDLTFWVDNGVADRASARILSSKPTLEIWSWEGNARRRNTGACPLRTRSNHIVT